MPLQTFRHYTICQDQQGTTVEVWRSHEEVACLAFDNKQRHFVELHVAIGPAERQRDAAAFQNLVQLAAPLRHRHLLGILEGGEDEGANFYVSEFLDGERLDAWLARSHPLPPWLALLVIRQLVEGLAALASHPRLLAGVEVFHAGLTLSGPAPEDLIVKVCDLGLSGTLPASTEPQLVEARAIHETGRLLLYMLTGSLSSGPVSPEALAGRQLPPELHFLLGNLFNAALPHHPRTLEQLRTLTERCLHDLPQKVLARPDTLPAAYRPRLPLAPHLPDPAVFAEALSNDYTLDPRPADAADPYRHRGTQRATRRPVNVQVLPPANLLPAGFCYPLIDQAWNTLTAKASAAQPGTGPHPQLLTPLAWHPELPCPLLVEELPGKFSLESLHRLRHPMEPGEVLLILHQLDEAATAAEARGLSLHWRSPRLIPVQFTAPGGEEALPPPDQLARQPLTDWPAFLLKLRTWPIALDFTQPDRFQLERLLPRDPALSGEAPALRASSTSLPGTRDFALLATWLFGGSSRVPEPLKPLLYAAISARGSGGHHRSDFLNRLHQRLQNSSPPGNATSPMPSGKSIFQRIVQTTQVPGPSRKSSRPSSPPDAAASAAPRPAGAFPLSPSSVPEYPGFLQRNPLSDTTVHYPLNRETPTESDGDAPSLGFAEALFGQTPSGGRSPGTSLSPPAETGGHDFPFVSAADPQPLWPALADPDTPHDPYAHYPDHSPDTLPPLGFMEAAGQAAGASSGQAPLPRPVSPGKLVLLVVVIAATIAALMAHFSGQAIWLK